jgi:perosamine synthetase
MTADGAAEPVPVSSPDLSPLETRNVVDAIESSWISSTGAFLERFEREFGEACRTEHVVPVANGTVALHLVLEALGVTSGDEVIVPSMTYIATANAVAYTGATPVFVDVCPDTWCLDPEAVAAAVTTRTTAVIAVHLYGHPADMDALRAVADRHGLALVEDAAEAPFAEYKGRRAGSLGDAATFSFYGNKVITSGEGGAVTTNDPDLAGRLRLLRGQGMDPARRYYFPVIGFNYRMTNVAAALLCGQLARVPEMLERRRLLYDAYDNAFGASPSVTLQPRADWATITPWLYSVLLEDEQQRTRIAERLSECGVDTRPFFVPIHTLPPYQQLGTGELPVTMELGARGLSLPTSSTFDPAVADRVAALVLEAAGR